MVIRFCKKHFLHAVCCALIAVLGVVCTIGCSSENEQLVGEVVVSRYMVKSKTAGRVLHFMVEEGDYVGRGDTIAVIDAFDTRVEMPGDDSDTANVTSERVRSAYQVLQRTREGKTIAERTYLRIKQLFDDGVVSDEKHDEALVNYKAMEAQERAAQINYDELCAKLKSLSGLTFDPFVEMRGASRQMLNEKFLVSEEEGELDEIYIGIGDMFSVGANIASVAVLDDVWGVFRLEDDMLKRFKAGERFVVYVPAFNKDMTMMVTEVNRFSAGNGDKHTEGYVEIKARPVDKIEGLRQGMNLVVKGAE